MQASIVDMRYKSKEIIGALDRGEIVQILYRGKPKGTIHPIQSDPDSQIKDHPYFGMSAPDGDQSQDVMEIIDSLRQSRY